MTDQREGVGDMTDPAAPPAWESWTAILDGRAIRRWQPNNAMMTELGRAANIISSIKAAAFLCPTMMLVPEQWAPEPEGLLMGVRFVASSAVSSIGLVYPTREGSGT